MDRRVARRVQAPLVNGLLLAAAALTLFPLLWMVSVSLMSPGEASSYPPPLVPQRATLGNYRELFGRAARRLLALQVHDALQVGSEDLPARLFARPPPGFDALGRRLGKITHQG